MVDFYFFFCIKLLRMFKKKKKICWTEMCTKAPEQDMRPVNKDLNQLQWWEGSLSLHTQALKRGAN